MLRFTRELRTAARLQAVQRFAIKAGVALSVMLGATLSHADTPTLTAGSPPSSAPTTFMDVTTQKIEGLMPDVVDAIGKREGFNVSFNAVPFAALIQSAVSGKIDIIVAQEASGGLRGARVVDDYVPMQKFDIAIAVKKGNTALLAKINDALTKMTADGSLNAILKKWNLAS